MIQDTVHAAKTDRRRCPDRRHHRPAGRRGQTGRRRRLLDEARTLHRHAQYMWDFISSSNSMGFHNPDEALRILQNATDLARQAQMKAAQAADDPSLLKTGVYDGMEPKPTPEP